MIKNQTRTEQLKEEQNQTLRRLLRRQEDLFRRTGNRTPNNDRSETEKTHSTEPTEPEPSE